MTLLASEGVRRLADERRAEQTQLEDAQQRAISVVTEAAHGIPERDLVQTLMSELTVDRSVASSAADYLLAIGVARKDWVTGLLTQVSR